MAAGGDKTRVLVIDDEPPIRRLLRTSLGAEGFEVLEAESAEKALAVIGAAKPDIAILDLGLPDLDGLDIIRKVRADGSKMPIIVLSSRAGERGKVEALDLGADDYVTKPFGIAELVARIRTALRHSFQAQGSEPVFKSGDLSVDLVRRLVSVKTGEVKLSPKEYEILRLLVLHAGKVLTHRFLMQEVWGPSSDVQYLRIYVRQLRQKIETEPENPTHILTETGVGYRLRVQETGAA
jgi:two-component system, OmpR family, KDP operon response regulator KdpE